MGDRVHISAMMQPAPHMSTGGAVVALPQEQLGWPVPQGDHPVRVPVRLARLAQREGPRQPKVGQLQHARLCDEDVGRLHVPVQDLIAVYEVKSVEQLLHDLLDLPQGELDVDVAQQARQVVLAEVKHQVERGLAPVERRRFGPAYLD